MYFLLEEIHLGACCPSRNTVILLYTHTHVHTHTHTHTHTPIYLDYNGFSFSSVDPPTSSLVIQVEFFLMDL